LGNHHVRLTRASRPFRVAFLVPLLGLLLTSFGYKDLPTHEEQAKAKWSEALNQ